MNIFNLPMEDLKKHLDEKYVLQFSNFFSEDFLEIVNDILAKKKFTKEYVPNKYSYSQIDLSKNELLIQAFEKLNQLVGKKLNSIKIKKFEHRDFTLLEENEKNQLILFHDLNDFDSDWGGYHYFQSYSEPLFDVPIEKNNTTIVKKSNDMFYFIKYINSFSKGSRVFLEVIYQ